MKLKIERRLSYLYTGESMALISFVIVSFFLNKAYPHLRMYSLFSFWFSFFLLEFLLVQGSLYWYTKWKRLKNENTSVTPNRVVRFLKIIKKWNILLIMISPLFFVIDFLIWSPSFPVGGLFLSGFIYIFAILEYINYFHIQLSYDNLSDIEFLLKTKKFKRSSLSKDFERIKGEMNK
ncbi:general stress protein [Robertmurraya sp. Marseille-Q9965]